MRALLRALRALRALAAGVPVEAGNPQWDGMAADREIRARIADELWGAP